MEYSSIIGMIMQKIKDKEEISYENFAMDEDSFGDLLETLQNEGYIKNANVIRNGRGNKVFSIILDKAIVTTRGMNYLEEKHKNVDNNIAADVDEKGSQAKSRSHKIPIQIQHEFRNNGKIEGNLSIINDKPSCNDKLGRENLAKAFAKYIAYKETNPPLSIGIFGNWGTGKSSFLELIEKNLINLIPKYSFLDRIKKMLGRKRINLERNNYIKVSVVKFNAWEYEEQEKIWFGMLKSIIDNYLKKKGFLERFIFKFTSNFKIKDLIINSLRILITISIGYVIIRFNFVPSVLKKMGINIEVPENLVKISALSVYLAAIIQFCGDVFNKIVSPLTNKFNNFMKFSNYDNEIGKREIVKNDLLKIENWLMKKGKLKEKLVIYIDDLDRCSHEKIIKVLEATQLFLNKEGIITIFGLDYRVMSVAIENNFKSIYKNTEILQKTLIEDLIDEYIEKFIQIPFFIPNPDSDEVSCYLKSMCNITNDENEDINIRDMQHDKAEIYSEMILSKSRTEDKIIELTNNEYKVFEEIVLKFIKGNARKIKNLRNLVLLNKQIYFSDSRTKRPFIHYITWFIFHSTYKNEAKIFLNECKDYYMINANYTINDLFEFDGLTGTNKDKRDKDYKFKMEYYARLYVGYELFDELTIGQIVEFSKLTSAFIYPNYNQEKKQYL